MRVSREQAEVNRANVVSVAGRMFRGRGFDGVAIADIMKEAGLTHGGFYGQFASSSSSLRKRAARRWGEPCDGGRRRWQARPESR